VSVVLDREWSRAAATVVRPLKVAVLGFGTVGASVARILSERPELADRIELTHIFNRTIHRKRVDWMPPSVTWTEDIDAVFAANPDVIVETVGGVRPAGEWVRRALERGISVVTANKMLIATEGQALLHVSAASGAQLRFEAAVCGGVPLLHAVRDGLAGDTLTGFTGILNGTSNYILSRMGASGDSMADALDAARALGYAEVDPSADIDGDDAAAKLVVLAGVAFGRVVPLEAVRRQSIRAIRSADFRYANRIGHTIRQVAALERSGEDGDRFRGFVGPALVPEESAFGRNDGANNLVVLRGSYGGSTAFSGAGAGGPATAVAVVSDVLGLAGGRTVSTRTWSQGRLVPAAPTPYYLRFVVQDEPGILARIASALAREGINIDAVLQEPGYARDALVFVVTVEKCEEVALTTAIRAIADDSCHRAEPLALPMPMGV
jgi:homoserine dehydrogenase